MSMHGDNWVEIFPDFAKKLLVSMDQLEEQGIE